MSYKTNARLYLFSRSVNLLEELGYLCQVTRAFKGNRDQGGEDIYRRTGVSDVATHEGPSRGGNGSTGVQPSEIRNAWWCRERTLAALTLPADS